MRLLLSANSRGHVMKVRSSPMRRLARALIVLATSTLVVCGVRGPPRPPAPEVAPDAGAADGGAR
jgi:predicted small lipoprotein YifL